LEQWYPELGAETLGALKAYNDELIKFNQTVNLIGVKTVPFADVIHFADCILASRIIFKNTTEKVIHDFGSGNGFPGLIMALLEPGRQFKLVEVDQRKAEFLKHMVSYLKLKNTEVLNQQVEAFPAGSIKTAVSRGFAPISKAILLSRKIFPVGGAYFHMKGEEWATEIAAIPTQLCSFWQPSLAGNYRLPVGEIQYAIVKTMKIGA